MIKIITGNIIEESGALDLVWRVFNEFEAPEYSDEGIQVFKDFIKPEAIKQQMDNGELCIWGYFDNNKIIGVVAVRGPCHISLLFVDKQYHRRGIARKLWNTVLNSYLDSEYEEVTVHSSPYAVEVYGRLGFVAADTERIVNGLRFTPMKYNIRQSFSEEEKQGGIRNAT